MFQLFLGLQLSIIWILDEHLNKKKYKIFPIYIDLKGNWYKYIKPIEEIEILQVGEIPQELEKINNEIEYLKNMEQKSIS